MKKISPRKSRLWPADIRLVMFDLDGTLVDAYPAIADSINFMLRQLGRPTQSLRAVKRSVGWGVDSLVSHFVEPALAAKALQIFRSHHDLRLREKVRILPGARGLLKALKARGCILAIASNRPAKFCHIILKSVGIDHYFDHVICGDMVRRAKPYPDMARAILKAARVKPSQAVFVGDMTVDVLCGRRAGVFTVGIPNGSCTRAELIAVGPDLLINRLSELQGQLT